MSKLGKLYLEKQKTAQKLGEDVKTVALGYVRVSTGMQLDKNFSSIDSQKLLIQEYVQKNPELLLEHVYEEKGKSAKNMKRPALQAMIKRIEKGGIGAIIAYKLDRLSRDKLDFLNFEKLLKPYGVKLLYTNDIITDNSTAVGELFKNIKVDFSAFERQQTAERIMDKALSSVKEGFWIGGIPPMGYKLSNTPGILSVDEDAAPYVRIIYEKFLDFHSPAEIARFMAKTYGLPPARITRKNKLMNRNPYCENYIRRILSNPIYAGYTYLRVENDSSAGSEYICFEGKHEAIINRDNWEKAKFLLKSGKKSRESHSVRVTDKHILKKILQCSCGSYMTIGGCGKRRKDNSSYLYYLCTKKVRERDMCGCDTRIALHAIETVIFASIMHLVNSGSANVSNGVTDYEKSINEELPKLKNRFSYLKRKLKENVDMLKDIPDGEVKRHLLEESEEIGREKSRVELRMDFIAKERDEIAKREVSDPIKRLSLIKDISSISDSMSDEERRSIIQRALKKAVLTKIYSESDEIKNYIVSLFLSPDFSESIKSCDVKFQIRLVGRTKLVRILSPFQLDHITTTSLQSKAVKNWTQGKHPMHKVVAWDEYRKATMCTYEKLGEKFGMSINTMRPRIYIMQKLSCEALSFVLSLNRKDLIEQLTFIFLKKVAQMPCDMQLECIHRRLNAYLGRDEDDNGFEDFLVPVAHKPEDRRYPQLGTNGHFLNDVIRWRKLKMDKSLSLSGLVDYLGIKKAMISRKLALLEKLSNIVIESILELKNPIQIAKCTFRALERISEFPKNEQVAKLAGLLGGEAK